MKKNLFYIYSFAVCFIATIVSIISLGFSLIGLLSFLQPKLTIDSYQFKCYQSNEDYELCLEKNSPYNPDTESYKESTKLKSYKSLQTEADKKKHRLKSFANELELEKREGLQSVIFSSIFLFVSIIFFYIHWNFAKKPRNHS